MGYRKHLAGAYEKCSSRYSNPHIIFIWIVCKPCNIDEMAKPVVWSGWEGSTGTGNTTVFTTAKQNNFSHRRNFVVIICFVFPSSNAPSIPRLSSTQLASSSITNSAMEREYPHQSMFDPPARLCAVPIHTTCECEAEALFPFAKRCHSIWVELFITSRCVSSLSFTKGGSEAYASYYKGIAQSLPPALLDSTSSTWNKPRKNWNKKPFSLNAFLFTFQHFRDGIPFALLGAAEWGGSRRSVAEYSI